ncbi:hypothetical protein [Polaribacter glomeratus]|nr:hypothetical protein [Polaribacter glomeratus]
MRTTKVISTNTKIFSNDDDVALCVIKKLASLPLDYSKISFV